MGPYSPHFPRKSSSSSCATVLQSVNVDCHKLEKQSFSSPAATPASGILSPSTYAGLFSDYPEKYKCIKCVIVGDAAVGKTSMIVSYTTDGYPREYIPTAFDNYSVLVLVDGKPVKVQLCDTAGQDDFDILRPLCYPNADVLLLCFSVINPTSFHNIHHRWMPELGSFSPNVPILLLGTESDLRTDVRTLLDLNRHNRAPVSLKDAHRLSHEIGAICYIECSSLTQQNLKEAFDAAILAALKLPTNDAHSRVRMDECRGRKSFRNLKNRLVIRSNSADCLKNNRVKRSASSNATKLARAISIRNLNFLGGHSSQARGERMAPTSGRGPMLKWRRDDNGRCTKEVIQKNPHYDIGYWKGATTGKLETDLAKIKKGWKKLLCVV